MDEQRLISGDARARLLDVYDKALPRVFGYLLSRCGERSVAEDLTAETCLAAAGAVRADASAPVSTAWLVGVARHKLSDHSFLADEHPEIGVPCTKTRRHPGQPGADRP